MTPPKKISPITNQPQILHTSQMDGPPLGA